MNPISLLKVQKYLFILLTRSSVFLRWGLNYALGFFGRKYSKILTCSFKCSASSLFAILRYTFNTHLLSSWKWTSIELMENNWFLNWLHQNTRPHVRTDSKHKTVMIHCPIIGIRRFVLNLKKIKVFLVGALSLSTFCTHFPSSFLT